MSNLIKRFLEMKLTLIPVEPGGKKPLVRGWEQRMPSANDPRELAEKNIGVVLGTASAGLVDIDVDNEDALKIAAMMLPPTGWKFGRPSNPRSHYIYQVPDPGPRQAFAARDLGTIIECRGNGSMTVFPPSVHSGEEIRFDSFGEVGKSSWSELVAACRWVATAVVLRHYFTPKNRHDPALIVSGWLAENDVDENDAHRLMTAICTLAGDTDLVDRLRAVTDTYKKYREGGRVRGGAALADLVGGERAALELARISGLSMQRPAERRGGASSEHNDVGVARRLEEELSGAVRWVPERRQFVRYDGVRWRFLQTDAEIHRMAEEAIVGWRDGSLSPAGRAGSAANRDFEFLNRCLNNGRLNGIIERFKKRVESPLDAFDAAGDLLGVANGVLDLRSGRLLSDAKDARVTRSAGCGFDDGAACPHFDRFLRETFGGDEALINYVLALLRYGLLPDNPRQNIFIACGAGANGKSTLLGIYESLLGDYAVSLDPETLFEQRLGQAAPYDLARLKGRRVAIAQEAQAQKRLHAAKVKQLTGGDTITAREIYRSPFQMQVGAKIWLVTNHLPELDAHDPALARRLVVIPFDHVVPREKRDGYLISRLRAELSGILNRIMSADLEALRSPPDAVLKATEAYLTTRDTIGIFLDEFTACDASGAVPVQELYESYRLFCAMDALEPLPKNRFGAAITARGYRQRRSSATRSWVGLTLRHTTPVTQRTSQANTVTLVGGSHGPAR